MADLGRVEEAMKDYTKAIDINPKQIAFIIIKVNIISNYFLGIFLDKLGKNEEAIKDYTKSIHINPQNTAAYGNRGRYQLLIIFRIYIK